MSERADAEVLEGREAFQLAAPRLVGAARLELRIFTQALESSIYGQAMLVDALRQQLLSNRRLRLRCLVIDARGALRQAPDLIALARRLSSQCEFRCPAEDGPAFADEALIADRGAYLHRGDARSHAARFSAQDPIGAHELIRRFDTLWDHGRPATELRQLSL